MKCSKWSFALVLSPGWVKNHNAFVSHFKLNLLVTFFVLVSSASPFPRGVCSSVWYDSGGVRPTGSVEKKWAKEAGSTVLIWKGRLIIIAIRKNLFHCHGWEPVVDPLLWKTKFWSHQHGLLAQRGRLYARWLVFHNRGWVLKWCVSNRDCSTSSGLLSLNMEVDSALC